MEVLQFVDNKTSPSPTLDTNDTSCYGESMNYIPTVEEYEEALGGYGIAFVTIGSLTTALLYLLFFQQVLFTFCNTHKVYRRHIYWLISIYPFVTLMSTVAVIVPRAHQLCTAIKVVYMSIGVGHFADLTLLMYGSENKMLDDLENSSMQLNLMPLCCFFPCLPTPPISKLRLSLLKWMIWQMKWTQAIYYIIRYILAISIQYSDGTVSPQASFLWLTLLNFASFLSGVYALNIMGALSNVKLLHFRYRSKCLAVKLLILTIKMQGFVFDLLGIFGAFPCLGPMVTPVVFQNTLENSVFLVEMVIFGLFSYIMYRLPEFNKFDEPLIPTTQAKVVRDDAGASVIQVTEVKEQPGPTGATKTDLTSSEGIRVESQSIEVTRAERGSIEAIRADQGSIEATRADQESIKATRVDQGSIEANRADRVYVKANRTGHGSIEATRAERGSIEATNIDAESIKATRADSLSNGFESAYDSNNSNSNNNNNNSNNNSNRNIDLTHNEAEEKKNGINEGFEILV